MIKIDYKAAHIDLALPRMPASYNKLIDLALLNTNQLIGHYEWNVFSTIIICLILRNGFFYEINFIIYDKMKTIIDD